MSILTRNWVDLLLVNNNTERSLGSETGMNFKLVVELVIGKRVEVVLDPFLLLVVVLVVHELGQDERVRHIVVRQNLPERTVAEASEQEEVQVAGQPLPGLVARSVKGSDGSTVEARLARLVAVVPRIVNEPVAVDTLHSRSCRRRPASGEEDFVKDGCGWEERVVDGMQVTVLGLGRSHDASVPVDQDARWEQGTLNAQTLREAVDGAVDFEGCLVRLVVDKLAAREAEWEDVVLQHGAHNHLEDLATTLLLVIVIVSLVVEQPRLARLQHVGQGRECVFIVLEVAATTVRGVQSFVGRRKERDLIKIVVLRLVQVLEDASLELFDVSRRRMPLHSFFSSP